jgi:hypothetical protein
MFDTLERRIHTHPRSKGHLLTGLLVLIITVAAAARTAQAQSTTFMYQGKLTETGAAANGVYDLEFKLYDAVGGQVGPVVTRDDVQVTDGLFTVPLDFGLSPFTSGTAFTLEIGVRPGDSSGAFTALTPRQPISSSPYAIQTINAAQLGGVPADQYVKTDDPRLKDGVAPGPGSTNYIQNTSAQQADANFNISGNGLVAGQLGIGTQTPQAGTKLDVNGLVRFSPGGSGGFMQFGTPNTETGLTWLKSVGTPTRADIRFNGTTLTLASGIGAGVPGNTGVVIDTAGRVGIGLPTPSIGRLHALGAPDLPAIYGESPNRGVWGKSTGSSYGVYGESTSGIGVQGVSRDNVGVVGSSVGSVAVAGSSIYGAAVKGTSQQETGVVGQTASSGPNAGVKGVSTASFGIGVRGEGNTGVFGFSETNGGTGVIGSALAPKSVGVIGNASGGGTGVSGIAKGTGTGVIGTSESGYAMYANGNAGQARDKGGFVKAMVYVDPFLPASEYVVRCYNGVGNSSSKPCGFTVKRFDKGSYRIEFGFPISDRFYSLTTQARCLGSIFGSGGTSLDVLITDVYDPLLRADAAFWLIVY